MHHCICLNAYVKLLMYEKDSGLLSYGYGYVKLLMINSFMDKFLQNLSLIS